MNTQNREQEKIKSYLLGDLPDAESAMFEDRFFEDDVLFDEITEAENQLVDRYASDNLTGEDRRRLKFGLVKFPSRREKIANAIALKKIVEENSHEIAVKLTPDAQRNVFSGLTDLFSGKYFAFGAAVLTALFLVSTIFLFFQNQKQSDEIARLGNRQSSAMPDMTKQSAIQKQIDDLTAREADLQKKLENANETNGDLADELQNERRAKEKIVAELEELKRHSDLPSKPSPSTSNTVLAVLLKPAITIRDGGNIQIQTLKINSDTKVIAMHLLMPDSTAPTENFAVLINGKEFVHRLKIRNNRDARKYLEINVNTNELPAGKNQLTVTDSDGKEVQKYFLSVNKNKTGKAD